MICNIIEACNLLALLHHDDDLQQNPCITFTIPFQQLKFNPRLDIQNQPKKTPLLLLYVDQA
jgi:hypothetical protein